MANEKDPFGRPDADGWYEWRGDGMIRPAGLVEVKLRDGYTNQGSAESFAWWHADFCADIVKWRPANGC